VVALGGSNYVLEGDIYLSEQTYLEEFVISVDISICKETIFEC